MSYQQRQTVVARASASGTVCAVWGLNIPEEASLRTWNPQTEDYAWMDAPTGKNNRGLGQCVIVQHDDPERGTYFTLYGHLDAVRYDLEHGTQVCAGDVLGKIGNSGSATKDDGGPWLRSCRNHTTTEHQAYCLNDLTEFEKTLVRYGTDAGFGPHVHFEIKDMCVLAATSSMPGTGGIPGYAPTFPFQNYEDPVDYIYNPTSKPSIIVSITEHGQDFSLRGGPGDKPPRNFPVINTVAETEVYTVDAVVGTFTGSACKGAWIRVRKPGTDITHSGGGSVPYAWLCTMALGDCTVGNCLQFTTYSPVHLMIFDPDGDSVGMFSNSIGENAVYLDSIDFDGDGDADHRVTVLFPKNGQYSVRVMADASAGPGETYSLGVRLPGGSEELIVLDAPVPSQGQSDSLVVQVCQCNCASDPHCDGVRSDVLDIVNIINVAFRGAAAITDPNAACPYTTTDVNCSGATDVLDVVSTVNVAFRGANTATEFCNPCP